MYLLQSMNIQVSTGTCLCTANDDDDEDNLVYRWQQYITRYSGIDINCS